MKVKFVTFVVIMVMVNFIGVGAVLADLSELRRITAEEAFIAVQTQKDPCSGEPKNVVLVDVRSRAEFFWVGTPAKVNDITLKDDTVIIPDLGMAQLVKEGQYLRFTRHRKPMLLPICKVKAVDLAPIAINIPYRFWDETTATLSVNEAFALSVEALVSERGAQVVIFFCRSGGRSQACLEPFDTALFEAVYEIDQPDLESGLGGFEGTTYSNSYLGYRGFPGRNTRNQSSASVSWKDSALPIKTSVNPLDQ